MRRPAALATDAPWPWSPGRGVDVWAMFVACAAGDLATVERLVAQEPALARCHFEYRTPLSFAVRENQREVAAFLLEHGALPLTLGDPLQMARDRGHAEMAQLIERVLAERFDASAVGEPVAAALRARDLDAVRALLDGSPELVHAADRSTNRPIHWATMTRNLAAIDELAARGAELDAPRMDGARPIHLTNGDYGYRGWRDVPREVTTTPDEVYRHLVARGAHVDIWMACVKGDLARVRQLLDDDPTLVNRDNAYGSYYAGGGAPLWNAAAAGHTEIVRLLLARGADPNQPQVEIAPNGKALYGAVFNGHHEIAELLLAAGANPNAPVESSADAVWIAIRAGDERMLRLLGARGAEWAIPIDPPVPLTYSSIVATGITPTLPVMAYFDDRARARALLDAHPDREDDPEVLAEALEQAARRGHEAFADWLLARRPELATRVTVLAPLAMAEWLFARGMDASRRSWLEITPLHHAAGAGRIEEATLLLAHGADLEAIDDEQRSTPLGWAAERGRREMVELLLAHGARPRPDGSPEWAMPESWARRRGHDEIATMIARAAAGASSASPRSIG